MNCPPACLKYLHVVGLMACGHHLRACMLLTGFLVAGQRETNQAALLRALGVPLLPWLSLALVQRLATRALRAADRESVRDRDDYALVSQESA